MLHGVCALRTATLSFICGLVVWLLLGAGCAGDVPARIAHNCLKSIELHAERIRLAQVAPLYRLKWRARAIGQLGHLAHRVVVD